MFTPHQGLLAYKKDQKEYIGCVAAQTEGRKGSSDISYGLFNDWVFRTQAPTPEKIEHLSKTSGRAQKCPHLMFNIISLDCN